MRKAAAIRLVFLSAAIGCMAVSAAPASAVDDHGEQLLPNIDVRQDQKVAPVAPRAAYRLDSALGGRGFRGAQPADRWRSPSWGAPTGSSRAAPSKSRADIVLGLRRDNDGPSAWTAAISPP